MPTAYRESITMHNALFGWLVGKGSTSSGLGSLRRGRKRRAERGRAGEQLETRCLPAVALVAANGQNVEVSPTVPIYNWNGTAFFWGQQAGTQGFEPWLSDGTAAGTRQLLDINAGAASSIPQLDLFYFSPNYETVVMSVGNRLFFSADNGTQGTELWTTDGTSAGTRLVRDIAVQSTTGVAVSSFPANLTNVNGVLYFSANNRTNGRELWRTDAAGSSVRMVADINVGSFGSLEFKGDVGRWANIGDDLIFAAENLSSVSGISPGAGFEVWRTTNGGTGVQLLRDIQSGVGDSDPENFVAMGNQVFFTATNTTTGRELWVTDGTTAGTFLLRDIYAGSLSGLSGNPTFGPFNDDELTPINNGTGNLLYFSADNSTNGEEVWRTDGTTAGTQLVADLNSFSVFGSQPYDFTNLNGRLVFGAEDTNFNDNLYISDGMASGTTVIGSGLAGSVVDTPRNMTGVASVVAFVPDPFVNRARDNEVWVTDGTTAGTAPANPTRDPALLDPQGLVTVGNLVFMTVAGPSGQRFLARYQVSEPPTDLTLDDNNVPENSPIDTLVGNFVTTDPDFPNDSFTYRLAPNILLGPDNGLFKITGGQLLTNFPNFNFEMKAQYRINVEVTDRGGNKLAVPMLVNITDVNEAPTDLSFSPGVIVENRAAGTLVGNFQPSDPDRTSQTYTYALVAGTDSDDNALFTITGNTVVSNAVFDFETKNVYKIRVAVTDNGGLSFEKAIQVRVLDDNEAPASVTLTGNSVLENQPEGTVVGTIAGTDTDAGDTLTFSVESTSAFPDGAFFSVINGNQLVTNQKLDFEAKPVYNVLLRVTDQAGAFFQQAFAVNVRNLDDVATTITLSNQNVDENRPGGSTVGTLSTLSPAYAATLRFELSPGAGGEDNNLFQIVGNSLQVAPGALINFESKSTLAIRVKATDPTNLAFEERFVVNVRDLNEAPAPLTLGNNTVAEAQLLGTLVGLLRAPDPEQLDTVTFSLVPGPGSNDNAKFRIFGSGLQTNAVLSFDTQRTYSVRVRASDQNGAFTDNVFTITATQVPKAFPMFRAFNPQANYHFYTSRQAEFDSAIRGGYKDERSTQNTFQVLQQQVTGASPLFRLYNFQTGRHYYTVSQPERDFLASLVPATNPNFGRVGWRVEPSEGFLYPVASPNTVEIYRLYNNQSGAHLFTPSVSERDSILVRFPGIWVQHSSLGFGFVAPAVSVGALPATAAATAEPPASAESTPAATSSTGAVNVASLVATPVTRSSVVPTSAGATAATDAAVVGVTSSRGAAEETAGLDALFAEPLLGSLLD
jgi:ELWxxDGT repeat protein